MPLPAARHPRNPRFGRRRSAAGADRPPVPSRPQARPRRPWPAHPRGRYVRTSDFTRTMASCTFATTAGTTCANRRVTRPSGSETKLANKTTASRFPTGCAASSAATGPEYDPATITYGFPRGKTPGATARPRCFPRRTSCRPGVTPRATVPPPPRDPRVLRA